MVSGNGCWRIDGSWWVLTPGSFSPIPQVGAKVPPPPASHTAHTSCSWFSCWCRRRSEPSSSSSSSLPALSASRQSPLSWSLLWQVGRSVGTPGWGHTTLGVLCPLPPYRFPTGHWLVASACRGAGRIRPVVPREEPRYRLTSTPER